MLIPSFVVVFPQLKREPLCSPSILFYSEGTLFFILWKPLRINLVPRRIKSGIMLLVRAESHDHRWGKGTKHYYTYSDEKGKTFAKISVKFANLDKIQQTVGLFLKSTNINKDV
jgi:hypothetical protein